MEIADESEAGEYRALTRCIMVPAKNRSFCSVLSSEEKTILKWIREAGLRLTMAELVFLLEHAIAPLPPLLGPDNRQSLTERIYTQDNILETQMEHAVRRDRVVKGVLRLLRKKRILLL